MDTKDVFQNFVNDLKSAYPDVVFPEISIDDEVKSIETHFYPSLLQILQREATFFDKPRIFCGVDISPLWQGSEGSRDAIWKHLQMCVFSSFMHGDIKEKISSLLGAFKNIWSAGGHENDDISKILNDEESEDHFKEIFEYLSETRLAKVFQEIVEEFDVSDLNLNFENPQEIIDMFKSPDNPAMKNITNKIQAIIKRKMERGEFTQNQLMSEVEGIKAKVQSLFGNVFNDMLGGRRADVPANVLMGNSPEARRQRMLARLQKKQREKTSH